MNALSPALSASGNAFDRISARQFKQLAALILARTGIKMPPTKQTMLEGRLRRRARDGGFDNLHAYCDWVLSREAGARDIEHLINAVTTNKTDFFREPKHFEYLVDRILPALVRGGQRSVRCWSAACSTGAEPYTLAMLLSEFAESERGFSYTIVATDLDTQVLSSAIKGIYPSEMIAPVPKRLRQRYVMEARDRRRAEVRMAPDLRRKVGFGQLNLMESRYPVGEPMDLIFCRNVLIYFDKATQEQVVNRLCEQLRPGGHLFLGHSESISGFKHTLSPVGNTIFQKA
ncbi:chemotaxis protein CheR [Novosphingobium sp. 1949]|uniref:Chemotaxis protein methyltransferase n=1 Tax=Novosphingobium organovorum TaxID=2930092 RepID=A0ABT0BGM3_9SPHN|nr:CheR family methyltransferase [Novosphingobium organovorum]MCJ2183961.1 chemotaxis protein CheR [Novosphingobium organovorum]